MRRFVRWLMRNVPRPLLIRMSLIFGWVLRPFYFGNRVSCPVCGHSFRKFMPYGVSSRLNVLCPSCFSLERHRLLWLWWRRETDFFTTPYRILHVAPEQCFVSRFRRIKDWDYTTADLESPMADIHFDLHEIPLADGSFDWVICNHVLEHVADDRRVMSEILRILDQGGRAILQVPLDPDLAETHEDPLIVDPAERERQFGQRDHVRRYGRDFPDRLREAGFDVQEIDLLSRMLPDERSRYRLPEREIIYLAVKT